MKSTRTSLVSHDLSAALAPLVDLVAARVLAALAERGGPRATYSQADGERPPGCGRAAYLRIWRAAAAAGDPGATAEGRARLLTPDGYDRHAATVRGPGRRAKPAAPAPARSSDPVDDVLAELGARRAS